MDTNTTQILTLAILGVLSGGGIIGLVLAYRALINLHPTTLRGKNVRDVLLTLALEGIGKADRVAADVLSRTGNILSGADKKAIADSTYNLWPKTIVLFNKAWPIGDLKDVISLPEWEKFVQTTFDGLAADAKVASAYFLSQVDVPPVAPTVPPGSVAPLQSSFNVESYNRALRNGAAFGYASTEVVPDPNAVPAPEPVPEQHTP